MDIKWKWFTYFLKPEMKRNKEFESYGLYVFPFMALNNIPVAHRHNIYNAATLV